MGHSLTLKLVLFEMSWTWDQEVKNVITLCPLRFLRITEIYLPISEM